MGAHAYSGPFAVYNGGADMESMNDDSAVAFEGKSCTANCGGTTLGKMTCSAWLRSDTATTATLRLTTNGTGSVDCAITGLTSTPTRHECTGTVTGSPTSTICTVLVGDDVTDTGTIGIVAPQCDRQGWATSEKINLTAIGQDRVNIDDAESTTWPSDADSGEIEVVFRLDNDVPTDDYDNNASFFLYDVPNDTNTDHRIIEWYQQSTTFLQFRTTEGVSGLNTTTNSQLVLAADTDYVTRARWVAVGGGFVNHYVYLDTCADRETCAATTLVASSTDGTRVAPVSPYGPVNLGRRFNDIFGMNGHLIRMTVRQGP
jgi:hypothetical protein